MIGYYVALETFWDPIDGDLIEAGITYVSPEADVYRRWPERFKLVQRSSNGTGIARIVSRAARSTDLEATRPSWELRSTETRPRWFLGTRCPSSRRL